MFFTGNNFMPFVILPNYGIKISSPNYCADIVCMGRISEEELMEIPKTINRLTFVSRFFK